MQENGCAANVSYICYSTVLIDFLRKKPLYIIEVFDEDEFFSNSICEHFYDPIWMTSLLQEFYAQAMDEHMKYGGNIHPTEVEKILLTISDGHIDPSPNLCTSIKVSRNNIKWYKGAAENGKESLHSRANHIEVEGSRN